MSENSHTVLGAIIPFCASTITNDNEGSPFSLSRSLSLSLAGLNRVVFPVMSVCLSVSFSHLLAGALARLLTDCQISRWRRLLKKWIWTYRRWSLRILARCIHPPIISTSSKSSLYSMNCLSLVAGVLGQAECLQLQRATGM